MSRHPRREAVPIGVAFPDVLAAAQANAPWAFERLFDALASAVVGYLRAQGAQDPDGLANDVFLRVFTNLERFEGGEQAFRSWVFTIAHHRLIDDRRRASRRPDQPSGLLGSGDSDLAGRDDDRASPGADVEEKALQGLGEEWVRDQLAKLAPDQRDVLLLRVVADLTVEQVAKALGKSPEAVKALQRRGLIALRRSFQHEGVPL